MIGQVENNPASLALARRGLAVDRGPPRFTPRPAQLLQGFQTPSNAEAHGSPLEARLEQQQNIPLAKNFITN
ncbi:hypothetical protein VP1G_11266 [Cytospora mali]|uniref:Uncharacterized protein n=1 Tax=Cytospora mali TaxID=578113 RepID=A0A194VCK3_CYTMA|nr:hypothetical protein VP1G_11266 [Valsa mali var. pyri (nom. inval.)]